MKRAVRYNRRYVPSLDGLRALAVLMVIAYHLNAPWVKGGFIGVDIFFVLSGYLITHILLTEWSENNALRLEDFWMRRCRRLVPAAYAMVISVVIFAVLFNRDLLVTLRGDAAAAFLYISNWWYIFHDISYFDSFKLPSPLKNLWSLAIEEQFYLVWPLLLYAFLRWVKNPVWLIRFLIFVAFSSVIWMGILYAPGSDPSRAYYGTDTRLFDLLIGCILAFIWPFNRLNPQVSSKNKMILNLIGGISLGGLCLFALSTNEYQTLWYRGGLFIVAILSAVVIAITAHPSSLLSKLFKLPFLRWIGKRSYGIYLWHYPVIVLSTPLAQAEIFHPFRSILQVIVTFLIAEFSFRFIEAPILQIGFINYIKKFFHYNYFRFKEKPIGKWLAVSSALLVTLTFGAGMSGAFSPKSKPKEATKEVKIQANPPKSKKSNRKENPQKKVDNSSKKETTNSSNNYKQSLAIGDSVLIDVAPYLKTTVPNLTIDGKVGRQLKQALALSSSYTKKFNNSTSAVIFELGTNGSFTKKQLNELLSRFNRASIYLINVRVPRPWESMVNATIKDVANNKNVTVIDWYEASEGRSAYFARDGVHLTKTGAKAYVELLAKALKNK